MINTYIKKYYNVKNNKEIAKDLNISVSTVSRHSKKLGLSRHKKLIKFEDEIFKNIDNFSKYKISNYGRIVNDLNKEVKPSKTPDGYLNVKLYDDLKNRHTIRLNRLVLQIFNPIKDDYKYQANHINGVITDNSLKNLEWLTPSENQKHAYKNGLKKPICGEKNKLSKYKEEDIKKVCILINKNFKNIEIEKITGVERNTVSSVRNKYRWKSISDLYF